MMIQEDPSYLTPWKLKSFYETFQFGVYKYTVSVSGK